MSDGVHDNGLNYFQTVGLSDDGRTNGFATSAPFSASDGDGTSDVYVRTLDASARR